jgi:hypothetical protein
MSKTPDQKTFYNWYIELLRYPSFLLELSDYQRDKLIQYIATNKIDMILNLAINCLEKYENNFYPEDLPEGEKLNYILNTTFKGTLKEPLRALNILGWHWTPEKSYQLLKNNTKPEEIKKESDQDKKDNRKYKLTEIAFILFFKNKNVRNPENDTTDSLKKIIIPYLEKLSRTTPKQVHEKYNTINTAFFTEKTYNQKIDSILSGLEIKKIITIINYIENIIPELNNKEKEKAEEYIKEFKKIEEQQY